MLFPPMVIYPFVIAPCRGRFGPRMKSRILHDPITTTPTAATAARATTPPGISGRATARRLSTHTDEALRSDDPPGLVADRRARHEKIVPPPGH